MRARRTEVRVLDLSGAHLIVRQSVHVLEQMEPRHQPGWQARATRLFMVELALARFEARPISLVRRLHQGVAHVDHVCQQHLEQFEFRPTWLLRGHRRAPSVRQPNHAAPPCASPYVHGRAKSQGFPQNRPEPCDFQYVKRRFSHPRSKREELFMGDL